MKFRVILGSIFVLFQFIPLGGYHFEGEAHIVGGLYNILFPHGVLSVVLGGFLIFYERWGFKRLIPLNYLLILGGTMIVLVSYYEPADYILGLWHGVEGDFDTEGVSTGFLTGILSLSAGVIISVINSSIISKHRRVIFASLIFAVLLLPFPATVYFKPPVQAGEYLDFVEEQGLFEPGGINFQSYPEGVGGVRVSRENPLPRHELPARVYEMYGGEFIQYYRVEKLEGFSPTVYALYLSLSGKPVYSMGYSAIIVVLLIYVAIEFRAGSSGRGVR